MASAMRDAWRVQSKALSGEAVTRMPEGAARIDRAAPP